MSKNKFSFHSVILTYGFCMFLNVYFCCFRFEARHLQIQRQCGGDVFSFLSVVFQQHISRNNIWLHSTETTRDVIFVAKYLMCLRLHLFAAQQKHEDKFLLHL